jgi:hypothetical protein
MGHFCLALHFKTIVFCTKIMCRHPEQDQREVETVSRLGNAHKYLLPFWASDPTTSVPLIVLRQWDHCAMPGFDGNLLSHTNLQIVSPQDFQQSSSYFPSRTLSRDQQNVAVFSHGTIVFYSSNSATVKNVFVPDGIELT